MNQPEQLFRFREAADRLQISLSLFKRLRREGKVRVVKIGRRAVRVSAQEITRLCSRDE